MVEIPGIFWARPQHQEDGFRSIEGDIFDPPIPYDGIVIPINCFVKSDGCAVMGRGLAKLAAQRWPEFPKILGSALKKYMLPEYNDFPVLPFWVHGNDVAHVKFSRGRSDDITTDATVVITQEMPPDAKWVFAFPTKRDKIASTERLGDMLLPQYLRMMSTHKYIPGWALRSSVELIRRSATHLQRLIDSIPNQYLKNGTVLMPRVGCGAGELSWSVVVKVALINRLNPDVIAFIRFPHGGTDADL